LSYCILCFSVPHSETRANPNIHRNTHEKIVQERVFICVYMRIYINMCNYIYTYIQIYMYTKIHRNVFIWIHICMNSPPGGLNVHTTARCCTSYKYILILYVCIIYSYTDLNKSVMVYIHTYELTPRGIECTYDC
jgi:hypothetical protein